MTTSLPSSNCWANNKLLKKDNAIKLEINEKYIEPLLKFNPNNPKIKFMPLSPLYYDKHLSKLLENLENFHNKKKHEKFQKWLKKNANNIQIKKILNQMIYDIMLLIKTKEFTITDENQLRNNIATFVYSISS